MRCRFLGRLPPTLSPPESTSVGCIATAVLGFEFPFGARFLFFACVEFDAEVLEFNTLADVLELVLGFFFSDGMKILREGVGFEAVTTVLEGGSGSTTPAEARGVALEGMRSVTPPTMGTGGVEADVWGVTVVDE